MTSIYGELDTANECVKRIEEMVRIQYFEGKIRYRLEDIQRARKYMRESKRSMNNIIKVLGLFESIALKTKEENSGTILVSKK